MSDPIQRLDRRLYRVLADAERDLSHSELMTFCDLLAKRKNNYWDKHVYPVFRARLDSRWAKRKPAVSAGEDGR